MNMAIEIMRGYVAADILYVSGCKFVECSGLDAHVIAECCEVDAMPEHKNGLEHEMVPRASSVLIWYWMAFYNKLILGLLVVWHAAPEAVGVLGEFKAPPEFWVV